VNPKKSSGWVRTAFIIAFICLRNEDMTYNKAIYYTLSLGGDTDTNACIVGGLIGAFVGFNNLDKDKIEMIFNCDTSKGKHKRPSFLVPSRDKIIGQI
jgi:ADP-ribosyl-[dinitrogen reductase] hydrolase